MCKLFLAIFWHENLETLFSSPKTSLNIETDSGPCKAMILVSLDKSLILTEPSLGSFELNQSHIVEIIEALGTPKTLFSELIAKIMSSIICPFSSRKCV